jgi:hypothetical protein
MYITNLLGFILAVVALLTGIAITFYIVKKEIKTYNYIGHLKNIENKERVIEIHSPGNIEFFRNDSDVKNKERLSFYCFQKFNINNFSDLCNFCEKLETDVLNYQHHLKCKEWNS